MLFVEVKGGAQICESMAVAALGGKKRRVAEELESGVVIKRRVVVVGAKVRRRDAQTIVEI